MRYIDDRNFGSPFQIFQVSHGSRQMQQVFWPTARIHYPPACRRSGFSHGPRRNSPEVSSLGIGMARALGLLFLSNDHEKQLFYVCGRRFLFQSCSIGNPQYAPEVWHQTPGTTHNWRGCGVYFQRLTSKHLADFFPFIVLFSLISLF
jgi:hypothetical protein